MRLKAPALIFEGSSAPALGVARSLARNGVITYYVASKKNETVFSKYFKQCFFVPEIETSVRKAADFLVEFSKKYPLTIVYPGSDLSCVTLACVRAELDKRARERFHFLLPGKQTLETLINKRKFYHSLSNQDIPFPTTYFPECLADVAKVGKETDYPVYLKPCLSEVFANVFKVKGFVAKSPEELIWHYKRAMEYGLDILIQEYVPGPDSLIFGINAYFDEKSDPLGLFAYRRIRGWPHDFGYCSLVESIAVSSVPEVGKLVEYLHQIGHHGLADAEFKKDPRDGKFKFLEVNPRVWFQNSFPTNCGINLDFIAYLDAIHDPTSCRTDYEIGAKWANFLSDFFSALDKVRKGELSISDWLSSLHRIDDWAYFASDDILPCLLSPFFSLQRYAQRKAIKKHGTMLW